MTVDIRVLNKTDLALFAFNASRLAIADGGRIGFELKGWDNLVGTGSDTIPRRSIQDLWPSSLPARQVFYSYIFRPKYSLRNAVHQRLVHYDAKEFRVNRAPRSLPCATFHVRRGDILFHPNQARYYLPLTAYLKAAKIHMKTFGIRRVMLFTDSRTVIDEAKRCALEFPDLCKGKCRLINYFEKAILYNMYCTQIYHFSS